MSRKSGEKKEYVTHISNLFQKYTQRLQAPQKTVIRAFIAVLEDRNINISEDVCNYNPHSKTLSVRTHGPIKTEITLQQQQILKDLESVLGSKNTPKTIL